MRLSQKIAERLGAPADAGRPGRSDYDLNPQDRPAAGGALRPAAVLVPLIDRPAELTVLLTRRTEHLNDHAGQISFPGGRLERTDASPAAAALRETEEEVGIEPGFVEIVGRLDIYETVTGYAVTPLVGIVQPEFTLAPDSFEVAEVFEVPFAFLMDPTNHLRHSGWRNGRHRHWYAMPYNDYYIWGATAGMLINLYHRVGDLC